MGIHIDADKDEGFAPTDKVETKQVIQESAVVQQTAQQAYVPQQQQQQQQAQVNKTEQNFNSKKETKEMEDIFDLFADGTTTVGVGSDAALSALKLNLEAVAKENGLNVHVIPTAESQLCMPIVVLSRPDNGTVAYQTLLLPRLGGDIPVRYETIDREQVRIELYAAHAHDEEMVRCATRTVALAYSVEVVAVKEAGYFVVPIEADLSSEQLASLLVGSARILLDDVQIHANGRQVTAKDMAKDGLVVNVANMINYGKTTSADHFGLPIASDVLVTASVSKISAGSNVGLNQQNQSRVLCNTHIMMDYIYSETKVAAHDINASTPGYHAVGVITDSSALAAGRCSESINTHTMSLLFASHILSDYNYLEIYAENPSRPNISAFGLEHNLFPNQPAKFERLQLTDGMNGREANKLTLQEIAMTYCYPTMTVAMDIIPGSRQAASQKRFLDAAKEVGVGIHNQKLISEMDKFFNGNFAPLWGNRRIMSDTMPPVAIHLGTFYDDHDNLRDLREVNYVETLDAFGEAVRSGPEFANFMRTFEPGQDTKLNLAYRRKALESYCKNLTFTGIGSRVFFAAGLQNALLEAAALCGLRPKSEGLRESRQQVRGRGFQAGAMIDTAAVRNTFNSGNASGSNGGGQVHTPYGF